MNRILKKEQIFTVPNVLSVVRLLMIPVIIWMYCFVNNRLISAILLILSGITDIADGIIARKCNMVSDFGKILDPVADKLTQVSVIICIAVSVKPVWILVIMFAFKELIMSLMGLRAIKRLNVVNCAKWYGKANTVVLYSAIFLYIIFPSINAVFSLILLTVCAASLVVSLSLYIRFYYYELKK